MSLDELELPEVKAEVAQLEEEFGRTKGNPLILNDLIGGVAIERGRIARALRELDKLAGPEASDKLRQLERHLLACEKWTKALHIFIYGGWDRLVAELAGGDD